MDAVLPIRAQFSSYFLCPGKFSPNHCSANVSISHTEAVLLLVIVHYIDAVGFEYHGGVGQSLSITKGQNIMSVAEVHRSVLPDTGYARDYAYSSSHLTTNRWLELVSVLLFTALLLWPAFTGAVDQKLALTSDLDSAMLCCCSM